MLLEEPELSLHPEIVRVLPQMLARVQRRSGRQVFVSTGHRRPQQPHQAQGPVRELFLALPRSLCPPVLVLAPEVRRAARVPPQIDLLQLRNRHPQGALYATEPGSPRALLGLGDLLQKIAAEGIVRPAD